MTEPLVKLRHARALRRQGGRRLCLTGIEAWCTRYGISMTEFTDPGVPGERFLEINHPWGLKALAVAREEAGHGLT